MKFLFVLFVLVTHSCFSISVEILDETQEYLIPDNHPVKNALDQIFSKGRVVQSEQAMAKAGFVFRQSIVKKIIVAKHPLLDGYLVKTYLDNNPFPKRDWKVLIQRIVKAIQIQATIDLFEFQDIMKVPKKWIYLLPENHLSKGEHGKTSVLVVEDMNILTHSENGKSYKTQMTKRKLRALYQVISENLLMDCVYIRNVPFCEDGRLAFIDTELIPTSKDNICFDCLTRNLSENMQIFWQDLLNSR